MLLRFWIHACITFIFLCVVPCRSFSPCSVSARGPGGFFTENSSRASQIFVLHGQAEEEHGGTAWIKKSMGSDGSVSGKSAAPPSSGLPEFTQDEIDGMEKLIVSLSKVSDDGKRRETLADILDEELSKSASLDSGADGTVFDPEIPRFAKLFQMSLDNIGESVQASAREAALSQQEEKYNNGDDVDDTRDQNEGGDVVGRLKSPEEMQLWALIDMMVQSKTRVKLHMGSLGRKGEFR